MKRSTSNFIILAAAAAIPMFAQGQMTHDSSKMDHGKMADAKGDSMSDLPSVEGEVRRVDKAAGKVTLRHGEIKQLDMPPMTMVFEVKDKSMLDAVKPGDKVNFKVINDKGRMIVTEIKPAN